MNEADVDAHIRDCGVLMQQAFALGMRAEAAQWLEKQAQAIRSRTPEHVARLERERGMEQPISPESQA